MVSDIRQNTNEITSEETRCRHMGYSFRLAARVLLYAPSHRQDSTNNDLYYASRGALARKRDSSMGPPCRINPTIHRTTSEYSNHGSSMRELENNKEVFYHSNTRYLDIFMKRENREEKKREDKVYRLYARI